MGPARRNLLTLAVACAVIAAFGTFGAITASTSRADTVGPIDFEAPTYTVGSINGQDGWTSGAARDQGIVLNDEAAPAGFGTQSFRLSDATTSGAFGDQTFSKPTVNAAGEPGADAGGYPTGTLQNNFDASFDFASATGDGQAGTPTSPMLMSVSPDRGDGARMSYVRMEDDGSQWNLFFVDYEDVAPLGGPGNLNAGCSTGDGTVTTPIGSYSLASAHNVRFDMQFVPGGHNDVVKVYVDGALKVTGTSWEDYYRYCAESGGGDGGPRADESRIVDRLLFRVSGDPHPADEGKGFLIDNVTTSTTTSMTTVPTVPGAPTIGSVAAGDGAVGVSFTPGAQGSPSTTGYLATCVSADGDSHSNQDTGSPIVVPGLTNGVAYQCSVLAWNDAGNGPPSDDSSPVTPTPTSKKVDDCTDQTVCTATIPQPPSKQAPGQAATVTGTPSDPTGAVVMTGSIGTLACDSINGSKPGPITELTDEGFSAKTRLTITMTLKIARGTTPGQICYESEIPFFGRSHPTEKLPGTDYLLRCDKIGNVAPCVISSKQVRANIVVKFVVPGGDPRFCVLLPKGRLQWLAGSAAAKLGAAFNAQLQSTGGKAPVHWKISTGKLPSGLSLNGSTGSIAGTPKVKGSNTAVIAGTDSASPPQTAKLSVPIKVT
jgi:hypothetical protein